jgi:NitT/TauT family transport system permease protein
VANLTTTNETSARSESGLPDAHRVTRRRIPIHWVGIPVLGGLLLLLWQLAGPVFGVEDTLIPPPHDVAVAVRKLLTSSIFYHHLWVTTQEILLGFFLGSAAAMVLGVVIATSQAFEKTVMPYIVGLQIIPKIALAPLFLIWLGYGISSKAVFAGTIVFFPMLVNTVQGLKSLDRSYEEMLISFGASKRQIFWHGRLPSAAPYVFAGLDIAAVFAITGAVVAEFIGSQAGLGYELIQFNFQFYTAGTFAVIVILSVLGWLLHVLVLYTEKRVTFWKPTHDRPGLAK